MPVWQGIEILSASCAAYLSTGAAWLAAVPTWLGEVDDSFPWPDHRSFPERHGAIAVQDAGTWIALLPLMAVGWRSPTAGVGIRWCCRRRGLERSPVAPDSLSPDSSCRFATPRLANPPQSQAYNSDFNSDPNPPRLIGNFP
ncbi:actin-related 2 3 complex subunit 3, partial [Trichoderma arundinaceum]